MGAVTEMSAEVAKETDKPEAAEVAEQATNRWRRRSWPRRSKQSSNK
jgi:hypothetical protein